MANVNGIIFGQAPYQAPPAPKLNPPAGLTPEDLHEWARKRVVDMLAHFPPSSCPSD